MALGRPARTDPPTNALPVADDGRHSEVWTGWFQDVADHLYRAKNGTTTNDDAKAGEIGEYLSATGSTGFSNNVPANIATLSLTAGDWDVRGQVAFGTTLGILEARAWLSSASGASAPLGESIISLAGGTTVLSAGTQLLAGPARFSLGADATVYLGGLARFTSGAATANGTLSARRVR